MATKLERFEDFCIGELVYSGLESAILWFEKNDPENEIISFLKRARAVRRGELEEYYNSERYRERPE